MGKTNGSFNGHIEEIPFIHVDNFLNKHKSAYFISHYHADHVVGLEAKDLPAKLEKNNSFIYASKITIAIIKNNFPNLEPFLRALELGRNSITIKEEDQEIYLTVITLPAGHSLGSVMYIFQYKQTILFSGDVRISPNTLTKYNHLHSNSNPIKIDVLYIDTTFQDVPYFPKRSDVVRNVIKFVKDWLDEDERHEVLFSTSAGYGYECVCNEVYNELNIKTFIGDDKWNIFSQFPKELYGVTNDRSSRVKMFTKYEIGRQDFEITEKTLVVYFSAIKWCNENLDENFINIISRNKIEICFATHCCRNELVYFVNYLQPLNVVGFPKAFRGWRSEKPPPLLEEKVGSPLLGSRKRLAISKPNTVADKKLCKENCDTMFEW